MIKNNGYEEGMLHRRLGAPANSLATGWEEHCRYHFEYQCRKHVLEFGSYCDGKWQVDGGDDNGVGALPKFVFHCAHVAPRLY